MTPGSTVTCAGAPGAVNADVGVSPGSTTTGFPPCTISGSTNLGPASPAAQAQLDLTAAYDNLVARPCGTVVTPADLGGRTLPPGVYCVASSLAVTGTVTLSGPANGVWVFPIGVHPHDRYQRDYRVERGARRQRLWQVGSSATLGTGTTFRGNILAFTTITLAGGVTMAGRALARNGAVSLSATNNIINLP